MPPLVPTYHGVQKVGLEVRGAALAVLTGSCLAAAWSLVNDHDLRRLKKTVAGGALGFFGSYIFIRGTRFNDVQTAAVVTAFFSLAAIVSYSRIRR